METKLNEVMVETAPCAERLTFGQYLRSQVDAAKKALDDGILLEQSDLEVPLEELVVELAKEKWLPEIRSQYELLGVIYFLVTFDSWDPGFY